METFFILYIIYSDDIEEQFYFKNLENAKQYAYRHSQMIDVYIQFIKYSENIYKSNITDICIYRIEQVQFSD
jgi:hypothetical protein